MNEIQHIYDLIAKGQACTVDALSLATGLDVETVKARIAWLRDSKRVTRDPSSYRPARYVAIELSAPPRAYRPRQTKGEAKIERKADSGFMALTNAWGK